MGDVQLAACTVDPCSARMCDLGTRGCIDRHERVLRAKVVAVDLDDHGAPSVTLRMYTTEEDARHLAGLMIDDTTVAVIVGGKNG